MAIKEVPNIKDNIKYRKKVNCWGLNNDTYIVKINNNLSKWFHKKITRITYGLNTPISLMGEVIKKYIVKPPISDNKYFSKINNINSNNLFYLIPTLLSILWCFVTE